MDAKLANVTKMHFFQHNHDHDEKIVIAQHSEKLLVGQLSIGDQSSSNNINSFRKTPPIVFLVMMLLATTHSCITGVTIGVLPSVIYCLEDMVFEANVSHYKEQQQLYYDPPVHIESEKSRSEAMKKLNNYDETNVVHANFNVSQDDWSNRFLTNSLHFPVRILQNKAIVGSLLAACSWGQPLLCLTIAVLTYQIKSHDFIYFGLGIIQGLLYLPIPLAFSWNYKIVYIIRILQGTITGICGAFIPLICEKYGAGLRLSASLVVLCTTMSRLAGNLPMITAGSFCLERRWRPTFYIFGVICSTCASVGMLFSWRARKRHVFEFNNKIQEMNMDDFSLNNNKEANSKNESQSLRSEFCGLLSTYNIYALCFSAFATYCVIIFKNIFLPKYFSDVFNMPLAENRWYIIWPPIVGSMSNVIIGAAFSTLEDYIGPLKAVKLIHASATVVPSALLLCMVFIPNLVPKQVLVLQCAAFAFSVNNNLTTYRFITIIYPGKKGILALGLVFTFISSAYIFVPYIVEFTTTKGQPRSWIPVICTFVTLLLLSCVAYLFIYLEDTKKPTKRIKRVIEEGAKDSLKTNLKQTLLRTKNQSNHAHLI